MHNISYASWTWNDGYNEMLLIVQVMQTINDPQAINDPCDLLEISSKQIKSTLNKWRSKQLNFNRKKLDIHFTVGQFQNSATFPDGSHTR